MSKPIPIKEALEISKEYDYDMVIIFAANKCGDKQHITTFGNDEEDSKNAAVAGNQLKEYLGWNNCEAIPLERICGNCKEWGDDLCFKQAVRKMKKYNDKACSDFYGLNWDGEEE